MFAWSARVLFFLVITSFGRSNCEAVAFPNVTFQIYTPRGFSVSIPDVEGLMLFAFHGRLNRPLKGGEPGEYSAELLKPKGHKWIYSNTEAELKVGDVIHYWIYVQYNQTGHRKNDLEYEITELLHISEMCNKSITVTEEASNNVCKGDIIFEDEFIDEINSRKWTVDHFIPTNSRDYEFVSYQNDETVLFTNSSKLYIQLHPHETEENVRGTLDLGESCTGSGSECWRQQVSYQILPPVVSARINSKFMFQNGKVEVKAKLPSGDWIYPQIELKSDSSDIEILIAQLRGNNNLTGPDGSDIGSCVLFAGVRYHLEGETRDHLISLRKHTSFAAGMHVYAVVWEGSKLTFSVDGNNFGAVRLTEQNIPKNQKFHITLGVGVGGIHSFPNGCISGQYEKPWRNKEVKQLKKFFDARDKWLPTWRNGSPALEVDYVRVYAV